MEKKTHTYKFKAEVKQLLDILAHSLYTNREIFLRELISNSSDALEKLRFETLKGSKVVDDKLPLEIRIDFDKDQKTLTISDTGIGMTQDELIKNIGTIAKSGTADFIKKMSESKSDQANIIGKFGVGFYSVFMVADKVVIKTRSFDAKSTPIEWISEGTGTFKIEQLDESLSRGTRVEIHLKEDAVEFAEKWKLEDIIKRHSNFVPFPIFVEKDQVNTVRAIWREPKFQLKDNDYNEFYKFLTYDSEDPLDRLHISIDAPVQYHSLIFIPKKNYEFADFGKNDHGLDLYVNRVLIQHENKDLIPEYLQFLRGVVDSEDVPLNISRETLQENLVINKIKNNLVTQILNHFKKMAKENPENYKIFWQEFGRQFKLGYTDYSNAEKFAELLRFNSSSDENADQLTSLAEYTSRSKPDQKEIYYLFAANRDAMKSNPHLEIFKKKGIEVLYLYDPIDEFVMEGLRKFKEFDLKSVEQADLATIEKFADQEDKQAVDELNKEDQKSFDKLLRRMKDILGDKVNDVVASKRLTDSPSCLVSPDGTMTSSMQKIMQIMNKDASVPQKTMEINQDHTLIRNLLTIYKQDVNDAHLERVTQQLYESALLTEGYLDDAHQMVNRIEELLEESTQWYLERSKK
jgi:molecular chaperone HtpG